MGGPLDGVRVFDLTLMQVGPWAGMQLGALGADVIHVEEPDSVHGARMWIPPLMQGTSVPYIVWNLNKRNILLNLRQQEDREVAYRLLRTCDVFLTNMRPKAAERLGLGYGDASRVNPRIVYASLTGYGDEGPMAEAPAGDPNMQAFTGWCSLNGEPGGDYQFYRHFGWLDANAGNYIVQGVLLGLLARDLTGKGQRIDLAFSCGLLAIQTTRVAEFLATGKTPPLLGSACATTVPHQAFLCQDQRWVAVGVVEERQWEPFCQAVGLPQLAQDPRFATNRQRVLHRDELIPLLEQVFLKKPRYYWILQLNKRGVPCAKFMEWDELRFHPQVTENEHVVQVDTPWGRIYAGGPPWKFSETPASMRSPAIPGEHSFDILQELEASAQVG